LSPSACRATGAHRGVRDRSATPRPITVLYIRDHLVWSGGTGYLLDTLPRFDPARIQARLCVLQPRGPLADRFASTGVRPIFVERRSRDPRRLLDLIRIARQERPDLLLLSGPRSMLQGRLLALRSGLPVILRFNNMLPEGRLALMAQRQLAGVTTSAFAVSHAVRHWAARTYSLPEDRIEVIHDGIDTGRYTSVDAEAHRRLRQELGISAGAPAIALLGRVLTEQKGQSLMIRGWPRLLERRPEAVLMIVGDGPDLEACRRLVRGLGLDHAVRFTGFRNDIPEILAAADLVVVPSLCAEGFSLVALEASAAGRPVVAFASGGLVETVRHEESGLIVPTGDWHALVDAVVRIIGDPVLADALGRGGRRHAKRFTTLRHVERLTGLCETVLSGLGARG
jgi:glycosyltransferase involved in cell wall biosynthesis